MSFKTTTLIAVVTLLSAAGRPVAGQLIEEWERAGGGGGSPTPDRVSVMRGGSPLGVTEGMGLEMNDRLTVNRPWLLHVEMRARAGAAFVTLGSNVLQSDAQFVAGDGRQAGDFLLEPGCGGQRFRILSGALALENWPGASCHVAAGAHMDTRGTAYAVQVGPDGYALLAVHEDSVGINWWGGQGEADQTSPCVQGQTAPCLQVANEGDLWRWSETDPPVRAGDEDDFVAAGWGRATEFMVDDAWKDSIFKSPYLWGGLVGAGVIICVLWLCQGDDVSGTVIVNPIR